MLEGVSATEKTRVGRKQQQGRRVDKRGQRPRSCRACGPVRTFPLGWEEPHLGAEQRGQAQNVMKGIK